MMNRTDNLSWKMLFAFGVLSVFMAVSGCDSVMNSELTGGDGHRGRNTSTKNAQDILKAFRDGLQAKEGDVYRFALTTFAMKQAESHPEMIPKMWKVLQTTKLDVPEVSADVRLGLIAVFLTTLDAAILNCDSRQVFEDVWKVREEATAQQRAQLTQMCVLCTTSLKGIQAELCQWLGAQFQEEKEQAFPFKPQVEMCQTLEYYLDDLEFKGAEEKAYRDAKALFIAAIRQIYADRISQLQARYAALRTKCEDPAYCETVVPDRSDKKEGPVQALLLDVQRALQVMNSDSLLTFGEAEPESMHQAMPLFVELQQLQQVRYNLWANNVALQVKRETPPMGLRRLAAISRENLHPALDLVVSQLQAELAGRVEKEQIRSGVIQAQLLAEKVPLSAF